MRRVTAAELLDDDLGTPEEISLSLDDLWLINRRLGGVSSSLWMLGHFFSRTSATSARILDVGCGDSRLAGQLRSDLLQRGIRAEFFVLDRRLTHLKAGDPSAAGLGPVVADVFAMPFPEGSFDVVMCNLFLHHFSGEKARDLLRSLARMAKSAVLVNDLERHILPFLFIRLGYPFARSRLTRHDGPASVRQAYTRGELAALAVEAGFRNFEAQRVPPFRLGLTIWK
ncbi:MAG TPA: methyltransferase domain-containing protein [Terriglobia bacterium]|nr:methyltransferase domain-containing protein [Terriglobia bacterium]